MTNDKSALSVKDLILDDEELKTLGGKRRNARRRPSYSYKVVMQSGCDFAIERREGRRRTVERLVILVSQDQYYIENGSSKERLTRTKYRSFIRGLKFRDRIDLPEVNWIDHIEKGYCNFSSIMWVLFGDTKHYHLKEQIRHGDIFMLNDDTLFATPQYGLERIVDSYRVYENEYTPSEKFGTPKGCFDGFCDDDCAAGEGNDYSYRIKYYSGFNPPSEEYYSFKGHYDTELCCYEELQLSMYLLYPSLYRYMIRTLSERRGITKKELLQSVIPCLETQESMLFQSFWALSIIQEAFGLDVAKKAVDRYITSDVRDIIPVGQLTVLLYGNNPNDDPQRKDSFQNAKPLYSFNSNSFLEYLFGSSVKQGYGRQMNLFMYQWGQVLFLQRILDIKDQDKYPKNLASKCVSLMTKASDYTALIEKKMWASAVEYAEPLEYKGDKYQIIVPRSPEDLRREEMQQSNCVGSYESRILRHETRVCFLRLVKPGKENESIVTIEVDKDGCVLQCKTRFNNNPSVSQWKFILEWEKARSLKDRTYMIPGELGELGDEDECCEFWDVDEFTQFFEGLYLPDEF